MTDTDTLKLFTVTIYYSRLDGRNCRGSYRGRVRVSRPSYKRAIEIIALNFAPEAPSAAYGELAGDVTVGVIATLFDKDADQVVRDVIKARNRLGV